MVVAVLGDWVYLMSSWVLRLNWHTTFNDDEVFSEPLPDWAEFPDWDEAERRDELQNATMGRFERYEATTPGSG